VVPDEDVFLVTRWHGGPLFAFDDLDENRKAVSRFDADIKISDSQNVDKNHSM
jgi:hypothetical protein